MGVNANVTRKTKTSGARPRVPKALNRKRLDRRGRTSRYPADVAAALGKQVMKTQAKSAEEALMAAKAAMGSILDDFYVAVKQRDAARLEAVKALWSNWRLALDRDFLRGALKLMHPAEIRPFVPDAEAESYRHLIGEVWSGAAETRQNERS